MINVTFRKYNTIVIVLLAAILICQIVSRLLGGQVFDWLSYLFWIIVAIDLGVLLVHRKVIVFNEEE